MPGFLMEVSDFLMLATLPILPEAGFSLSISKCQTVEILRICSSYRIDSHLTWRVSLNQIFVCKGASLSILDLLRSIPLVQEEMVFSPIVCEFIKSSVSLTSVRIGLKNSNLHVSLKCSLNALLNFTNFCLDFIEGLHVVKHSLDYFKFGLEIFNLLWSYIFQNYLR